MTSPSRTAEYRRALYAANRAWVDAFKLFSGCADCGLVPEEPSVLEFDHTGNDKKFNVGHIAGRTLRQVQSEAAKCDVVCANCHRIRTARRR